MSPVATFIGHPQSSSSERYSKLELPFFLVVVVVVVVWSWSPQWTLPILPFMRFREGFGDEDGFGGFWRVVPG